MSRSLAPFSTIGLDDDVLEGLLAEHETIRRPQMGRLWSYYRNAMRSDGGWRTYEQAEGLPERLRGPDSVGREVVIENDIAWRVHALVDFMFGKPIRLASQAEDPALRQTIDHVLDAVLEANGGIRLLQDMALLGSVYGHVDLLLRTDDFAIEASSPGSGAADAPSEPLSPARAAEVASLLRIETIEAPRCIPILSEGDYRILTGYLLRYDQRRAAPRAEARTGRWLSRLTPRRSTSHGSAAVLEIISAAHRQVYIDDRMLTDAANPLGRLPVVHVQNLSQPYCYTGQSEVEPLIPLQDELNTRLSDRANRVTLQSFRMYLGRCIDGFTDRPVGPGQMWMTDNPEASIMSFGGDGAAPSEDAHIREIREAMDKTSAVSPLAAGLVRAKIGNLSSENAMHITLMGLLAKTQRKRITYGRGLAELADLVLHTLDLAGVLWTRAADRRVQVIWPNPLPDDASRRLADAKLKLELGVDREQVLAELGYGTRDTGIT